MPTRPRLFVSVLAFSCFLFVSNAQAQDPPFAEWCEAIKAQNVGKPAPDVEMLTRVTGEYGQSDDTNRLRTWNVETACEGELLLAIPLWGDVSPPILSPNGDHTFKDSWGGTWDFQFSTDGTLTGVVLSQKDGTIQEMIRFGDPRSF